MTTAILTDPRYAAHTLPSHVERAERLAAIEQAIAASSISADLVHLTAEPADEASLTAVHTPQLLAAIRQISAYGGGAFDSDTYLTADSWQAATCAAGGAIRMVEGICRREFANGFALVRPPGHHATPDRAMGFCLINNIAVAARYALDHLGVERVAIVDYDVHHGNGTQDIFYSDQQVLFCSLHAAHFYPGTGMLYEMGDVGAVGATLNVPLPFGVGNQGYTRVMAELITPALRRWRPQLLLVSAGYDAHWSDPLGPMLLSVSGFERMTRMLVDLANELCDGKIALVLEGGYNLKALGAAVVACLHVLMGRDPINDPIGARLAPEPDLGGLIADLQRRHPLLQ